MTPAIKRHIDEIRNGNVPNGYKKTLLGVVPDDWIVGRFKDMFERVTRKNKEKNDNVLTISAQHGLINQNDFFNKTVASDDKSNYYLLEKGEFAYNKSYSTGYPLGALKRLEFYDKGIVSPLYICFKATEENKHPTYYTQYFEAGLMNGEIQAFAQEGARNHGLLNISVDDFFNSNLLIPSEGEQKKIAEILETEDRVIALKERLIEAKLQQKKCLMQQLLSGKKRLPGFKGKWVNKKISALADVGTGNADTQDKVDNGLYPFYVRSPKPERINSYAYDGEAILTAGDGVGVGKVIHYVNGKFNYHQRVYKISDFKSGCVGKFLYYAFCEYFYQRVIRMSAKNSVDSVRLSMITEMTVNMPSPEEQQAIADVLSTADHEIDLLRKDLEQEKLKKKSLMQLLLTGLVRVA